MEREKEIYRAQAAATGKPAPVIEKIVEGKMAKFYEEVCLLEQPFIKDQAVSIKELIGAEGGQAGREHHRAALCALQGGRARLDRGHDQGRGSGGRVSSSTASEIDQGPGRKPWAFLMAASTE